MLIVAVTINFLKYMELFHPYLKAALKNYSDIQVGVVIDNDSN